MVTYQTDHAQKLIRWYGNDRIMFLSKRMPSAIAMYRFALQSTPLDHKYDFMLFVRMDVALKDFFKQVFRPDHDNIMVSFPCSNHRRQPPWWVGDMLGFIPRDLFHVQEKGFYFYHNVVRQLRKWNLSERLGVYVNSHHRANAALGWNPLYYLPARPWDKKIERKFMRNMKTKKDYPYEPKSVYDIETIDRNIVTTLSALN